MDKPALTYGSVCSGIEAASVAWHPLGWQPKFFAEIEKFPSAVLAHRWPDVPNLGDFTTIGDDHGPVDILVGGTPCQSFSLAGLRGGLDDDRGNLSLEFLKLADRTRPRWLVWENVPGVLSSNGGRDFGAILGGMVELGYGFAYRVLDAQYIRVDGYPRAVPQRRRRVFVVGHLGGWQRAAAVLFERESLLRDPPPRRQAGQKVAPTISARTRGGGGLGTDTELDGGLIAEQGVTGALDAHTNAKWGSNQWVSQKHYVVCASDGQPGAAIGDNLAPTLNCQHEQPYVAHTLASGAHPPAVAWSVMPMNSGKDFKARITDVAQPLCTSPTTGNQGGDYVQSNWQVRRLTPRECERLQGFPDDYTAIPWRNKEPGNCPDGPRYKALGNSMAVNVMRWIGRRIQMVEDSQ